MRLLAFWLLIGIASVMLLSCAGYTPFTKKASEGEGSSALDEESQDRSNAAPLVYYVAVPNLKLYADPDFSSPVVAELPLNEKLLRYKNQKAFGFVKVDRTGQTGWVENTKLDWRKVKDKKGVESKAEEDPSSANTDQSAADLVDTQPVQEEQPMEAPLSESQPTEKTDDDAVKPDASVLDR